MTLAQQIEVLDWHCANGQSQKDTAIHFQKVYPDIELVQPWVSDWLRAEV